MNIIGNIFNCCNRYKNYKISDIEIKKMISENNNNLSYIFSPINHNQNTSINNNQFNNSKLNNFELNNSKNDEEEEKKSATFPKISQKSLQIINNKSNYNEEKKKIHTLENKKNDMKNTIISISDMSFISEKVEKKEENYSKLLLTGDLFFGKEIIITDSGMLNGKRNKKDGFSVFGLKNTIDHSGQLNNDFLICFNKDLDEIGDIETESGKVFEIIFNKKNKEYMLYFINPYLYLYYKINNYVYFYPQKDYFLFVGKIFLSINILKEDNGQIINIQVDNTYENKKETNKKYSFDQNKNIITIGRLNCDININEKCVSKVHGVIEFSKINQLFFYKDRNSTNGTNLLIKKDDFLKIKGEMNFKLEDVTFKIQEIP